MKNENAENPIAEIIFEDGRTLRFVLRPDVAPLSVKNFVDLAESGFYDGLCMHRVIPDFMIQGGGMTCGKDGLKVRKAPRTVPGEFAANGRKNDLTHAPGVISMARTPAPDSASSQFFVCVADCSFLDGQYAAFGFAADDDSVLTAIEISKTPTRSVGYYDDVPVTPVIVKTVKIRRGGKDE